MYRRLANYWAFYLTTLPFSLSMGLVGLVFAGMGGFQFFFLLVGIVFAYAINEVKNPEYYLFYFNNGISKNRLWLFAIGFNFLLLILIQTIVIVIYGF